MSVRSVLTSSASKWSDISRLRGGTGCVRDGRWSLVGVLVDDDHPERLGVVDADELPPLRGAVPDPAVDLRGILDLAHVGAQRLDLPLDGGGHVDTGSGR